MDPSGLLVVDDNPTVATALARVLADAGHDVRVATDGPRALRVARERPPELVLLDLRMPDMDGFAVCAALRADPLTRDAPVIVISAVDEVEDKVRAFEAGAADYVTKPFEPREVLARVACHLRLYRLQRELAGKNAELAALSEVKNRFLGMAAHDLRTPLTVIRGFAQLLQEKPDAETHVQWASRIESSASFMLRLVCDLLDLSTIEAGRLTLERTEADLREVLGRAAEIHRMLAAPKEIGIDLELPDAAVPAAVDADKLAQVLDNLVGNAVKFSPRGERVTLSLRPDGSEARISVRDRGPGLTAEQAERLFEPFEKGHAKGTAGEKSTGLGLAIARRIVTAHGGRLWAEGIPGQGTAFHFTLPR